MAIPLVPLRFVSPLVCRILSRILFHRLLQQVRPPLVRECPEAQRGPTGPATLLRRGRLRLGVIQVLVLMLRGPVARRFGLPVVATCHTLWYRDTAYYDVAWRGKWETEGGGPAMGHGIHQMDLLLSLLGPWAEVTAMAGRLARDTATEDVSMAVVRFPDGTLATAASSAISPRQTSSVRVDTERATLELEHLYHISTTGLDVCA